MDLIVMVSLFQGVGKMGKDVDMLNLTRNFSPCSCHFGKERINTDAKTSVSGITGGRHNREGLQSPGRV